METTPFSPKICGRLMGVPPPNPFVTVLVVVLFEL